MAKCLNICVFEPLNYLIQTHISLVKRRPFFGTARALCQAGDRMGVVGCPPDFPELTYSHPEGGHHRIPHLFQEENQKNL
jgi:hypothetical protein